MTSAVGAAHTSGSVATTFGHDLAERARDLATVGFVAVSLVCFVPMTTAPAAMLVFVGALDGLVRPIGPSISPCAAWNRVDLMGGYRYPGWLPGAGVAAALEAAT